MTEPVRFARREDIPGLKALWRRCFPGEPEEAERFFEIFFAGDTFILWEEAGEPVSMATLLPCRLRLGKKQFPMRYVYALCTHPDFRRGGRAAALLRFAEEAMAARGVAALCLLPDSEKLLRYYEALGWRRAFHVPAGGSGAPGGGNTLEYPEEYAAYDDWLQALDPGKPAELPGLMKDLVPGLPAELHAAMPRPMN